MGISRAAAWVDILLLLVLIVGFDLLLGQALVYLLGLHDVPEDTLTVEQKQGLIVPTLAVRVSTCTAVVAFLVYWRRQRAAAVGLSRRKLVANLLLTFPTITTLLALIYGSMAVVILFWPEAMKQMTENADRLNKLIPTLPIWGYALLMMAVAFYEELVFRGFLLPRLRRGTESWPLAILLSSALFTFPHALEQTWISLIPIALLSIVFSLVTIWRRSIVPAVGAHMLWNLGTLVLLKYFSHAAN